jgi:hypothetical protein
MQTYITLTHTYTFKHIQHTQTHTHLNIYTHTHTHTRKHAHTFTHSHTRCNVLLIRAIALVEDAIGRYTLPRFTVDKDFVADLREMPPALAEVYVMTIFAAWERRAARARTQVCVRLCVCVVCACVCSCTCVCVCVLCSHVSVCVCTCVYVCVPLGLHVVMLWCDEIAYMQHLICSCTI